MTKTAFRLMLVAQPGDPPPAVRLRQGLKVLFRRFGLRCVSAEELPREVMTLTPPGMEELSESVPAAQDARIEPCTPLGDEKGEKTSCALCGRSLVKYRPFQRFCSTDCRMRFHGRLSSPVGVTPSEHPRSAGVVSV